MNNIESLKSKFIAYETECKLLLKSIEDKEQSYDQLKEYNENLQKARAIVAEAGKYTQLYLKDYIENMVTTALQSVFEDNYIFQIDFDIKRNKPEAKISLKIRGEEVDPKDSVGGGVLDVASFALRIILWSIHNPRSANVLILDEPMKFLHGRIENATKMMKKLSKELNLQFIIVSQIEELAENADKVFQVKHNGYFSEVKEL